MNGGAVGHPISRPVRIEQHHRVDSFACGADDLDDWIRRFAWSNDRAGNARVFVAARGDDVVGYYTLSSAGVEKGRVPTRLTKGGAPTEIPCGLRGRMAVHRAEQGAHLGRSLLVDALLRVARISSDVGFRALLIHARDESARSWYLHQARSFEASPSDPLHLFLPLKELARIASLATDPPLEAE